MGLNLTDTERQLSELVFSYYHTNPKSGQRSRVSDDFARNLRGDEVGILRFATLLAKMAAPEHEDKIGKVVGFYATGSISDLLQSLLEPRTLDTILRQPLSHPTLGVNPIALWAHAFVVLQAHYSNVSFDHEYAEVADNEFRPAIHGDGINVVSVNGAILEVLRNSNLTDDIDHSFFATHQDEDGWVFSRGGIDG